ncbi:RIC1-domain-containing protein [Blastocladiella britannica]|nr:RIC1-domain-containing protein [Blastocladiella britannica]
MIAAGIPRVVSTVDRDLFQLSTDAFPVPPLMTGGDETLAMVPNGDAAFFATLGARAVYLWSTRPTVVVAKTYRSPPHLTEHGPNARVVWKDDSTQIAVVTTGGALLLYDLVPCSTESVLVPRSQNLPRLSSAPGAPLGTLDPAFLGPGEAAPLPHVALVLRNTVCVPAGPISCALFVDDQLLAASRPIPSISAENAGTAATISIVHMADLECTVLNETPLPDSAGDGDGITVRYLEHCARWGTFLATLSNGVVLLMRWVITEDVDEEGSTQEVERWAFQPILPPPATTPSNAPIYEFASMNPRFPLMIAARVDGSYDLFELNNLDGACEGCGGSVCECPWTRRLGHQTNILVPARFGKGCTATWSLDGQWLALGYPQFGFTVVSAYGGRAAVVGTKRALGLALFEQDTDTVYDTFFHGVQALFFGPGGFEMFLLPTHVPPAQAQPNPILVLPLLRALIALRKSHATDFDAIALFGTDGITLGHHSGSGRSVMADLDVQLHSYRYPIAYCAQNWPLTVCALDPKSRRIAAAGYRGLVLFSPATQQWQQFRDPSQEQQFMCRSMAFVDSLLCILAKFIDGTDRIVVFESARPLSLQTAVITHTLQEVPMSLHVPATTAAKSSSLLLMLFADGRVAQYTVRADRGALVHGPSWTLPRTMDPAQIVALVPDTSAGDQLTCLVHHADRVWRWTPIRSEMVAVGGESFRRVDAVFQSRSLDQVWAVTADGVKVFDKDVLAYTIPLDFIPLDASTSRGVIRGLAQSLNAIQQLEVVQFVAEPKFSVVIPNILEHALDTRRPADLQSLMDLYRPLPYSNHALEMLLHSVWSREVESNVGTEGIALLPMVVSLLKTTPDWLDVVANCVRKTELAMWDYLFSILGDPSDLFEMCLESGRLHTATAYLVILHNMESPSLTEEASAKLLERVLQSEDVELSSELLRFLKLIGGSVTAATAEQPGTQTTRRRLRGTTAGSDGSVAPEERKLVTSIPRSTSSTWSLAAMAEDEDNLLFVHILTSRHARKLLRESRIMSLANFVNVVDLPLVEFLKRERNRGAVIHDHVQALKAALHQFGNSRRSPTLLPPVSAAAALPPPILASPPRYEVTRPYRDLARRHSLAGSSAPPPPALAASTSTPPRNLAASPLPTSQQQQMGPEVPAAPPAEPPHPRRVRQRSASLHDARTPVPIRIDGGGSTFRRTLIDEDGTDACDRAALALAMQTAFERAGCVSWAQVMAIARGDADALVGLVVRAWPEATTGAATAASAIGSPVAAGPTATAAASARVGRVAWVKVRAAMSAIGGDHLESLINAVELVLAQEAVGRPHVRGRSE